MELPFIQAAFPPTWSVHMVSPRFSTRASKRNTRGEVSLIGCALFFLLCTVPNRVPVLRAARRFRLGLFDPERLHRPLRRTRPPRFGQSSSSSKVVQPGRSARSGSHGETAPRLGRLLVGQRERRRRWRRAGQAPLDEEWQKGSVGACTLKVSFAARSLTGRVAPTGNSAGRCEETSAAVVGHYAVTHALRASLTDTRM